MWGLSIRHLSQMFKSARLRSEVEGCILDNSEGIEGCVRKGKAVPAWSTSLLHSDIFSVGEGYKQRLSPISNSLCTIAKQRIERPKHAIIGKHYLLFRSFLNRIRQIHHNRVQETTLSMHSISDNQTQTQIPIPRKARSKLPPRIPAITKPPIFRFLPGRGPSLINEQKANNQKASRLLRTI